MEMPMEDKIPGTWHMQVGQGAGLTVLVMALLGLPLILTRTLSPAYFLETLN